MACFNSEKAFARTKKSTCRTAKMDGDVFSAKLTARPVCNWKHQNCPNVSPSNGVENLCDLIRRIPDCWGAPCSFVTWASAMGVSVCLSVCLSVSMPDGQCAMLCATVRSDRMTRPTGRTGRS